MVDAPRAAGLGVRTDRTLVLLDQVRFERHEAA
jgi:hypothetical protein